MDDLFKQLIERERSMIAELQGKIAHHELRIATIEALAHDQPIGSSLSGRSADMEPAQQAGLGIGSAPQAGFRDPRRSISESNFKLLQHIGTEVRTLDELDDFARRADLKMDRRAIRSFANIYRTRFGFIESPSLGRYRLTARAQEFLRSRNEQNEQQASDTEVGDDLA